MSVRAALRLLVPLLAAAVLAACSAAGGDPAAATPVKSGEVVAKDNASTRWPWRFRRARP